MKRKSKRKDKPKKKSKRQPINGGEIIHISQLKPDLKNVRRHNPRNIGMITSALQEVGAARSGVIDENGRVLAGNATLEALAQAGIEQVKVVDAKGDEWVVVRRKGLTEKQKTKLAIFDNRTSDLSDWDLPALESLDLDLSSWFLPYELAQIGIVDGETNDPNKEWRGMPECENQDLSAWKSIRVNFNSPENMKAFAKLLKQPLTENTRSIWYPAAEIGRTADKVYKSES